MGSFITAIGTAVPPHHISRAQAIQWMGAALEMTPREEKYLGILYEASGIASRYTVLEDYGRKKGDLSFFANTDNLEPLPDTARRMKEYRKHALPLSMAAVQDALKDRKNFDTNEITHLVQVSCTGMYAPGLDIELCMALGLRPDVERTSIQFMGCYAAVNALKAAHYICSAERDAKVLVVCTELCTLHFQKSRKRDDLVSNAIFGDGSAALLVEGRPCEGISLETGSFYCGLATEGQKDMAWQIGNTGFEMTLSSYVPAAIKGGIKELTKKLLLKIGTDMDEIDYYAIHPGGRRILEVCEEELGLSHVDNRFAYDVLAKYGNMSSPTVLFVLKEIWQQLKQEDGGRQVLSFAFGPGLTIESMLLRVKYVSEKKAIADTTATISSSLAQDTLTETLSGI